MCHIDEADVRALTFAVSGPDIKHEASFYLWCCRVRDTYQLCYGPVVEWFLCTSGDVSVLVARHFIEAYVVGGAGETPAPLVSLLSGTCKCKCKSSVLFHTSPDREQLLALDRTPWGPKLCTADATVLGFSLSGAPVSIDAGLSAPVLPRAQRSRAGNKASSNITRKRRLFLPLRQSLPERSLCCRAYLSSCLHYTQQVVPPIASIQVHLLASNASFILGGRPWLQSKHLEGVFRVFRLPQPGCWFFDAPANKLGFLCRIEPRLALAPTS